MLRIVIVSAFLILLSGCKSDDEKLIGACIDGLAVNLEKWAKYDGWSVKKADASIIKMEPDTVKNEKYNTDQFWIFEVAIGNFTVKNGFNADAKSYSICSGYVSKNSDGSYDAPKVDMMKFTLNDEKLGY